MNENEMPKEAKVHDETENASHVTEETEIKKTKKANNKHDSRMEKLIEKREMLKEKHTKSLESEKTAANRTKLIEEQLAKAEEEIHAEEVVKLDKLCAERNYTYDEIINFLQSFPPEATLNDIKAMTK